MTRFSETAQSVPCTGAQSRVVYMDPQLAAKEPIRDLLSGNLMFVGEYFREIRVRARRCSR